MPDACVSPGQVLNGENAPVTPPVVAMHDEASALSIADVLEASTRNEKNRQLYSEQQIEEIVNGSQYIGQQASSADKKAAQATAKELNDYLAQTSERTRAENFEYSQQIADIIANGTSVTRDTYWQNFKNKVYGWFVDSRNELSKFLGHFANMPGVSHFANPLIRLATNIAPKARALSLQNSNRLMEIQNSDVVRSISNRTGRSMEDVCILIGHYANMRHAPERNEYLLQRWTEELTDVITNPNYRESELLLEQAQELTRKIDTLTRFNEADINTYDRNVDGELYSSGYTNREAREGMERILDETGITREEAEQVSDMMSAEYRRLIEMQAEYGVLDPATRVPPFQNYVAMMSRNSEGLHNYAGAGNDATPYNPGSYYAIKGRGSAPDSAWVTLNIYSQKVATAIATRDFGLALNALELKLKATGLPAEQVGRGMATMADAAHLRSVRYSDLMQAYMGNKGGRLMASAQQLYNGGGMVAVVPRTKKVNGKLVTQMEKRFFYFDGGDFAHDGTSFSADMLNKALSADFKLADPGPLIGTLAKGTSVMSQLTTRFTPLFSPVSGMRDFGERAMNMVNRRYYLEDGTVLNGGPSLVASFLANAPRAGQLLLKGMRGQLTDGSREAVLWREFVDNGLAQKFSMRHKVSDRNLADLLSAADNSGERLMDRLKIESPNVRRMLNTMGAGRDAALRTIDGWNDYFQNLSAFTHYLTLREKGVGARNAGEYVMEMMNMSQRGSVAPWLQALAPFVVPTVQSGTAMLRSFGLGAKRLRDIPKEGWKGWGALIAAYGAYSMLLPMAKASLGDDAQGNSRFDALSLAEASRMLPIGTNDETGEYMRFHIGFGMPQQGAMLAVGLDRVERGLMTMPDLMFEVLFATMRNAAPGNWPEYKFGDHPTEFMLTVLTPQPFRPIMEVNQNLNYFGGRITQPDYDQSTARSQRGKTSTPRFWHELANVVREGTGVDLEPEVYEHFARGYLPGPGRAMTTYANQADDLYRGSNRPSVLDEVHPLLAALGISSWVGKVPNATRSLFYEAERSYNEQIRKLGLDLAAPPGSSSEEAEAWRRAQLAGHFSPQAIDNQIKLWKTKSAVQKLSRDFNRMYKDRWLNMEDSMELRNAFEELYKQEDQLYKEAMDLIEQNGGWL